MNTGQKNLMKATLLLAGLVMLSTGIEQHLHAQGYGTPLTMQGLNHTSLQSVTSRTAGGISTGMTNDASLMFSNPAALGTLSGIQVSLGGLRQSRSVEQLQQWFPLRYLPTFSLMMEGLLDSIPDPDLSETPEGGYGSEDSIPRAYDNIKPNWSNTKDKNFPLQAFAAVPFEIEDLKIVAGVGAVEYANLNYYFQNNNVLSPSIGSQRPFGVPLPGIGQETPVLWSQYSQSREGSLFGYGGMLSVNFSEAISVGVSGLLLDGSTDDIEYSRVRGQLRFGNNNNVYYYKLDSVYFRVSRSGTSSFEGMEFTLSSVYRGKFISLNVSIKPSTVITRTFKTTVVTDTTGGTSTMSINGDDEITLPWRGMAGLSLMVRENLKVGMEYELNPYADAAYKKAAGAISKPWLSNAAIRFGAEFMPAEWLAIRTGYAQQSEVFAEEGTALIGEPVTYSVYSAGCGVAFANVRLSIGYEYSLMKYQDMWQTNVNLNSEKRSSVLVGVAYSIE